MGVEAIVRLTLASRRGCALVSLSRVGVRKKCQIDQKYFVLNYLIKIMSAEKTVLIAEDNDDLAFLYQRFLGDTYRVRSAQTGREAIRSATPAVDLIILDYKLPDMLGTDVRDRLRASGVPTPVVMISGTDPELLPDGDGSVPWLTKPIYNKKLRETVRETLSAAEESR